MISHSLVAVLGVLAFRSPHPPVEQAGHWADVNGTRLYYEQSGHGPDVILIHGVTLDHRMWEPQVKALSMAFRVTRYDVRGFGRSGPATTRHDPVADLLALLDHLQISRAHIVGMSMGGVIATDFVLSHPDRSTSLVLISANISGFPHPAWGDRFTKVFEAGRRDLPHAKELWLHDRFMTPVYDTARVGRVVRSMVADCLCPELADPTLMPGTATPPAFGRLETIALPTLVINGEADDPDMLAIAEAIHTRVAGAQRLLVQKAGHLVNLEQPAATNKALLAFVKSQTR